MVELESKRCEHLVQNFKLCNKCLISQTGISDRSAGTRLDCYICKGLWQRLDTIVAAVELTTRQYDFSTFLIGLTMSHQICENEDYLRSIYKIRGRENIKSVMTKYIRKKFIEITAKKIDLANPEIVIVISLEKNHSDEFGISIRSRSITLEGVYKKKSRPVIFRNIEFTRDNRHKSNVIEDILRRKLISATGADFVSFSWLGKEDDDSLVLGKGRPFFATLKNPKRRFLKHDLNISSGNILIKIRKNPIRMPNRLLGFVFKVRVQVSCGGNDRISSIDLSHLNKKDIFCVGFDNKNTHNIKLVYSMRAKVIDDRRFSVTLICDSGLPIRRFVDGYGETIPNIADILKKACKCDLFDVLNIYVQNSYTPLLDNLMPSLS